MINPAALIYEGLGYPRPGAVQGESDGRIEAEQVEAAAEDMDQLQLPGSLAGEELVLGGRQGAGLGVVVETPLVVDGQEQDGAASGGGAASSTQLAPLVW
jgi:hypothetical protein